MKIMPVLWENYNRRFATTSISLGYGDPLITRPFTFAAKIEVIKSYRNKINKAIEGRVLSYASLIYYLSSNLWN